MLCGWARWAFVVVALVSTFSFPRFAEASILSVCRKLFLSMRVHDTHSEPGSSRNSERELEFSPAESVGAEERWRAIATDRQASPDQRRSAYLSLAEAALKNSQDRQALHWIKRAEEVGSAGPAFWEAAADLFVKHAEVSDPKFPFRIRKAILALENARNLSEPESAEWQRLTQKMISVEKRDGEMLFLQDYLSGIYILETSLAAAGKDRANPTSDGSQEREMTRTQVLNEIDSVWVSLSMIQELSQDQIFKIVKSINPEASSSEAQDLIYTPALRRLSLLREALVSAMASENLGQLAAKDFQFLVGAQAKLLETHAILPSAGSNRTDELGGAYVDTMSIQNLYKELMSDGMDSLKEFAHEMAKEEKVFTWLELQRSHKALDDASWSDLLVYSEIYRQASLRSADGLLPSIPFSERAAELRQMSFDRMDSMNLENFTFSSGQLDVIRQNASP